MSGTKAASHLERELAAKRKKKIIKIVQYTLAIIVTLIVMFPLYWMLSSSVKSQEEILLLKPTLWPRRSIWRTMPMYLTGSISESIITIPSL